MLKEYLSGNIALKIDEVKNYDSPSDLYNDSLDNILDDLDWNDCTFIGDDFCLGNFSMAAYVYNSRLDVIYTFNYDDVSDYEKGNAIKLIARIPDDDEREIINNYFDNYDY